ncbi:MAG: NRDE family protein [Mycobacteriales bacterium]
MCTVVVRLAPRQPVRVLALRDELTSRAFDGPGEWWPAQPGVVGGRDRSAGGTWCASDLTSGATALVLNRPQKRTADAGAPSRGVLPLIALEHGPDWPNELDTAGMASFALVLVAPELLRLWVYDGELLTSSDLPPGTHMVTSGGAEDGKADRFLSRFGDGSWRAVLQEHVPEDDPTALVVRHEMDGLVFATVFGQLIDSEPGRLHLEHSRTPWKAEGWSVQDY